MKPDRKTSLLVWMVPLLFVLVAAGGLLIENRRVAEEVVRHRQDTQQGLTLGTGPDLHLDLRVGELNEEGRLLFWRLNDDSEGVPFFIEPKDDYGVMVINQGAEGRPVARYLLASQSTRQVLDTRNLSEFRQAVAGLPKGKVVGLYGTCSVGLWQGLPEGTMGAFYKALKAAGARVDLEDWRIVCVCRGPEPVIGRR